jgi:cytochrome P450
MASIGIFIALCASLVLFPRILLSLSYKIALRRHGCKEAPQYPHRDPVFGIDFFVKFMKAFQAGNFLDFNKTMFDQHGKTFTVKSFGTRVIKTIDPEVSKAVHATYFANFGLQPLRYDTAEHLWGNGIIVVDGPHWKHGRALIKSSFDVVHIANFDRLRKHTHVFMELIPRDGATVNLAPLFKRLVRTT